MASGFGGLSLTRLLFLLLFMASISTKSSLAHAANGSTAATARRPAAAAMPGMQSVLFNETRRRLGSFQICALCTCCGGPKGLCLPSPCCYAINCNIPNRPFGFCSFTPKTCNCIGCHL